MVDLTYSYIIMIAKEQHVSAYPLDDQRQRDPADVVFRPVSETPALRKKNRDARALCVKGIHAQRTAHGLNKFGLEKDFRGPFHYVPKTTTLSLPETFALYMA